MSVSTHSKKTSKAIMLDAATAKHATAAQKSKMDLKGIFLKNDLAGYVLKVTGGVNSEKNYKQWVCEKKRVPTPDDISPKSLALFAALEPKIDILVLGVGDKKNIDRIRSKVAPFLREHKIGLEIMDTEDAIATFNFLNAEGRYVGAALYAPDDMVVTDKEYGRALALLKGWDTVEENPLLTGLSDTINEAEDLVKRLWSGDEQSWQTARKKVLESPTEREERMQLEVEENEKKRIE